jgi:hypothetical protein
MLGGDGQLSPSRPFLFLRVPPPERSSLPGPVGRQRIIALRFRPAGE